MKNQMIWQSQFPAIAMSLMFMFLGFNSTLQADECLAIEETAVKLSAVQPFVHTTATNNITKHMTTLDHSSVNGQSKALLFISQHYGKYNNHQAGVWYSNGKWIIYHEDRQAMPVGTKFNVFAVNPSSNAFQHRASKSNIKDNWTTINHPKCNGNPNAVIMVTQNYKSKYNPKPIGVWYNGRNWMIFNQDKSAMPENVNFNVLVLDEGTASSLNNAKVSVHTATTASKKNSWGNYLSVTNNTTKSDILFITQNWKNRGPYNNHIPAVWFGSKSWTIFNQDKKELPTNAKFNVVTFSTKASTPIVATKEFKPDPNFYYRLTTQWQGADKSLDMINDSKKDKVILAKTGGYTGQYWKFTPVGDGWYRITNLFQGDGKSLKGIKDGTSNTLMLGETAVKSEQYWKLIDLGNGYVRLYNKAQGTGKSLDIINDGKNNKITLAKTGRYTGQFWKLTKLSSTRPTISKAKGMGVGEVSYARIGYKDRYGEFKLLGDKQWRETNPAGVNDFQEYKRDEWSVYLHDKSRDIYIQLDLWRKKVLLNHGGEERKDWYDVIGTRL